MRAAGYYRVSTVRQAEEGISLADQRHAVAVFCEKNGLALVEEYCDRGASGTSENRPELQRMLLDAKTKPSPFERIVVFSQSRLFRNAPVAELTIRDLRKNGVEVVSVTQPSSHDESGDLVRQLLNVFDEHSSRETAKHVRTTMRANAEAGFWNGAAPPFGYNTYVAEMHGKKAKKKLAIDDVEARIIELIFRLAELGTGRSGPMGTKKIAEHLNAAGYRTRAGKFWHVGPLHKILTNPVYKGTYIYNRNDSRAGKARPVGEHVEVRCPAIVEADRFDAVQVLLKSRNPKVASPKVVCGPILLTGLARCADCGGAMTIRTGKSGRYRYYTCATSQARGKTACQGRSLPMAKLDNAVVEALCERLFQPERLAEMLREIEARDAEGATQSNAEMLRVTSELTDAKARLERLYGAIERGLADMDDDAFAARVASAKQDRDIATAAHERVRRRLGPKLDLSSDKMVAFGKAMQDRLRRGEVPFRKAYIRATVERIEVHDKEAIIYGRKDNLRRRVAKGDPTVGAVPSSVQKWRTRQDSNL